MLLLFGNVAAVLGGIGALFLPDLMVFLVQLRRLTLGDLAACRATGPERDAG